MKDQLPKPILRLLLHGLGAVCGLVDHVRDALRDLDGLGNGAGQRLGEGRSEPAGVLEGHGFRRTCGFGPYGLDGGLFPLA